MPGAMGSPAETLYRKVSAGEQIAQWTCDRYEGRRANEKVEEVWTADWKVFGLTADDFAVLQDLAALFKGLSAQMQVDFLPVGAESAESGPGYSGVPVRRISYRNGKTHQKQEITEVSRQDFEDALFEVPAGFRQSQSPWEGQMAMAGSGPVRAPAASSPAPAPAPAGQAPQPRQLASGSSSELGQLDCSQAIRLFREKKAAADVVQRSCPPDIANALVTPAAGPATPPAAPGVAVPVGEYDQHFSSQPTILQGGQSLNLSAKRVIRTAVRTAKATAIEALKDYAVQKAIQKGVEKAVQQAAVQSAASSFGGIGGAALSGFGGFGGGAKPGFQFVVLETAEAALKAVAGEAMFLIPARYRNMQLVRLAAQEGFRALESRKGRVRKGQFKRPDGPAMRDQVAWRLVQTTTRGAVYEVAQALESGAHYALVDGSDSAFDFSVR